MSVEATRVKAGVMAFVPVALFLGLMGLFLWATFGQRVDRHASPLIGKPAPDFVLPDMAGGQMELSTYRGKPVILNFYASWCAPCRVEHPQLLQLAKDSRFVVLGVAYRDDPTKTAAYLADLGNPYAQSAIDRQGAVGVQFGLAGVPETYVIGADGTIILRHQGEITPRIASALSARALASGTGG